MIFSFCEVFLNQSPVLLEHQCFYVVLSNLGKSSMFEKTPSLIFPDLCRRANHSSLELINRSYYLCSFTDEWLFGTDSANHKVLVFKPEQWECYLEQRKKIISLESFSLIKACALHKDYWFISAVGRERPHVHRMHKLFQEAPSHATSCILIQWQVEVIQAWTSILTRLVASPVVTKAKCEGTSGYPRAFSGQ